MHFGHTQVSVYLGAAEHKKEPSNVVVGLGWLVGCFGFNGPLRQYFSLYRAVSQREGERRERIDESKNAKPPHPHLLQAQ